MSSLSLSFLTCYILSTIPQFWLDVGQSTDLCYQTILRLKSWVVLPCNKWCTLSSSTSSLNVLSRKCNKIALSTFQSSPRGRKNYPDSPLLLHRQEGAAKWKHFFFLWKSAGRSSTFPRYQGHFVKLCNTSIGCTFFAQGLSGGHWQLQLLYCHTQIRSLARSRSETPANWETWGELGDLGGVDGSDCNRRPRRFWWVCLHASGVTEMTHGLC